MKTIKFLFLVLSITFVSLALNAQKPFMGTVKYAVEYEGVDAEVKAQLANEALLTIGDKKTRLDQKSLMYSVSNISDLASKERITLMSMMGMKIAVKMSAEDIKKAMEEAGAPEVAPEIKYIDETKTIAGQKCKKAEITVGDNVMEVYYADELVVPAGINDEKGIKGFDKLLMEYTVDQQGMLIKFKVKEVKKGKPKKHLFTIPDDYELKTPEELGTMF